MIKTFICVFVRLECHVMSHVSACHWRLL